MKWQSQKQELNALRAENDKLKTAVKTLLPMAQDGYMQLKSIVTDVKSIEQEKRWLDAAKELLK